MNTNFNFPSLFKGLRPAVIKLERTVGRLKTEEGCSKRGCVRAELGSIVALLCKINVLNGEEIAIVRALVVSFMCYDFDAVIELSPSEQGDVMKGIEVTLLEISDVLDRNCEYVPEVNDDDRPCYCIQMTQLAGPYSSGIEVGEAESDELNQFEDLDSEGGRLIGRRGNDHLVVT